MIPHPQALLPLPLPLSLISWFSLPLTSPDVNLGHVSVLTDSFAFGVMLIELLTDLHPIAARALVEEYSQLKDRIKAIEDAAKRIGWQDTRGARKVAAEVAASCTDGSATRITAEQALVKLERIVAPRASLFGDFNKRVL
jgi:hypothetical protein